jgi:hypothetical protein
MNMRTAQYGKHKKNCESDVCDQRDDVKKVEIMLFDLKMVHITMRK